MLVASNYTRVGASATDTLIESGSSLTVYGIVVQSTSAGQAVIAERDGSTIILELSVGTNGSAVMNIPFTAPRGLAITTASGMSCTIFHSNVT